MIEIKVNGTYTADKTATGCTKEGKDWEMIAVKDPGRGHKDVTIWATNRPSSVQSGGTFLVEAITSVTYKARKNSAGEWHDVVNIEARVKPLSRPGVNVSAEDFSDLPPSSSTFQDLSGGDDELPF